MKYQAVPFFKPIQLPNIYSELSDGKQFIDRFLIQVVSTYKATHYRKNKKLLSEYPERSLFPPKIHSCWLKSILCRYCCFSPFKHDEDSAPDN